MKLFGDIVEANGKTIKENNMETRHKVPVGTLVELIDSGEDTGIRLYVVSHIRDCDGTPLYSLGRLNSYSYDLRLHGYAEENLKIIKQLG